MNHESFFSIHVRAPLLEDVMTAISESLDLTFTAKVRVTHKNHVDFEGSWDEVWQVRASHSRYGWWLQVHCLSIQECHESISWYGNLDTARACSGNSYHVNEADQDKFLTDTQNAMLQLCCEGFPEPLCLVNA